MAHITQIGSPLVALATLIGACGGSGESRQAKVETGATDSVAAAASAGGSTVRRVSSVMIGKRIGSNNRMTEPTFQFAPQDTVFISVSTVGSEGPGTMAAAWRSQTGEVVKQATEPIGPAGENTVFQLSQPKGLKPGTYKVVLFLGDDSVDTKVFAVKK